MATMKPQTFFNNYRERSTVLTMQSPAIPAIKPGAQILCTHIYGMTVTLSTLAPFNGKAQITGGYVENGYAYYTGTAGKSPVTLRETDIDIDWQRASETETQKRALFGQFAKGRI